jgi:NADPH:quinone reductase-like Zn-dependent oxidoreductase
MSPAVNPGMPLFAPGAVMWFRSYHYPEEVLVVETVYNPETFARAKKDVYDRIKDAHFRPRIAKTFRFEDVVKAYQYLESNQQIGKVVLTVGA